MSIGQGVSDADYDPIWRGALRSKCPDILFEKWQRFEKFAHSTNRLRIESTNQTSARFQRYTVDGGVPTAPENLLICGLIIFLLEAIGCKDLRCEMPMADDAEFIIRNNGCFSLPIKSEELLTDSWRISWQAFSPRHKDDNFEGISLPVSPEFYDEMVSFVKILMADISHQWKVDELAKEANLSKRSLQRKLMAAGLSFSHLIRIVRIHEACSLLEVSDAALTSIAFGTGFSDSAHFSRDFRSSMGMTPTDYRSGFQEN